VFGLPTSGISPDLLAKGQRAPRSGLALFDRLMGKLAAL